MHEPTTLVIISVLSHYRRSLDGAGVAKQGRVTENGSELTLPFSRVGEDLFSRDVAVQVFSALVSLTSVFGMGTGGPSPLMTPNILLSKYVISQTILILYQNV